ncbi:conserved hypothetical protein [Ricinus communis]|uniref:Uncharacterized protein n=1 Tax=Ricinus communis TaxID=3988 RepID=B9T5W3_RICCO|nr:conserved hypothetical protein [Ricinus communis]
MFNQYSIWAKCRNGEGWNERVNFSAISGGMVNVSFTLEVAWSMRGSKRASVLLHGPCEI